MNEQEQDPEMICGLTADERARLRQGLGDLPQVMPPRHVWERVRQQARAEGLIRGSRGRKLSRWLGGMGIAAAVLLAVLVLPEMLRPEPEATTVPPVVAQGNPVPLTALQALMVQSRQLESDLRALPGEPHVMRVGTAAGIAEIEDRIAAIDYQLSHAGVQMTGGEKELFWRERVRLMKSLVQLRYAQAQRAVLQ